MKKKINFIIAGVLTFTIALSMFNITSFAVDIKPGTESDPLVSKSYVDKKINEAINSIIGSQKPVAVTELPVNNDAILSDVVAKIEYLYGGLIKEAISLSKENAKNISYIPVNTAKGKIILGNEGTEIILRSGSAVGYSSVANGIVNITSGLDTPNGVEIKANNMYIIPRKDGRGVKVTADSWFMIKGGYEIVG